MIAHDFYTSFINAASKLILLVPVACIFIAMKPIGLMAIEGPFPAEFCLLNVNLALK